jgi:hypothetical protein
MMAPQRPLLQWLCSVLLLVSAANALKFDLLGHPGHESQKKERCIRNFVGKDTLVVVTATVGGSKGDGMMVNIHVSDALVPGAAQLKRRGDLLTSLSFTGSRCPR